MGGIFADDHEDDERWLKEHRKHFPRKKRIPGQTKRRADPKQRPIIPIGKSTQKCPTCKQLAPVETFKNAMCLGCQASAFLGTL